MSGVEEIAYEERKIDILYVGGRAKSIIENQKKAAAGSTWSDRLHNILEQKFEEGVDFI